MNNQAEVIAQHRVTETTIIAIIADDKNYYIASLVGNSTQILGDAPTYQAAKARYCAKLEEWGCKNEWMK